MLRGNPVLIGVRREIPRTIMKKLLWLFRRTKDAPRADSERSFVALDASGIIADIVHQGLVNDLQESIEWAGEDEILVGKEGDLHMSHQVKFKGDSRVWRIYCGHDISG